MSKRAEQRALMAYPVVKVCLISNYPEYGKFDVNDTLRYVYQQGYEQAEKDIGWHSVKKALPPKDEEVIVLTDIITKDGLDVGFGRIAFGHIVDKSVAIDYNGWNIPGVRLWMPMPEIPKEEKK